MDEFYSLNSAGLVIDGPLSPTVLIRRLHLDAPDHMPGYFLFLSAWGNLVSSDLTIDLAQVPPGTYRLMAIVYDPQSRERLPWHNNADWIPEMLPLANVDIPP